MYIPIIIQIGISCKWTSDSRQFLLEHLDTIHESPSQIYHSALPFCPPTTWIHEYYGPELSLDVQVVQGCPTEWGVCSRTVSLGTAIYEISCFDNTIAVGSGNQDIVILDAITGSHKTTLSGHADEVNSVVFSSDGRSLVSGSDDMTVKLWDMQTGGTIKTFSGHTGAVNTVSISVDYTTIASGSADKTIRLWDAQAGECLHIIEQDEVYCVRFSPIDPQCFLSMCRHQVQQWNISSHQVGSTFAGTDVDFSPDGTQIVSCCGKVGMVQNSSSRAVVATFPVVIDDA